MSWTLAPASEFGSRSREWDLIVQRCTAVPFFRSAFIGPLLAEFGTGRALIAWQGSAEQSGAVAIVHPLGGGRWETFQPSQLPLGAWIAPSSEDWVVQACGLLRELPGFALSLGLTQLDPTHCPPPKDHRLLALQPYADTSFIDVDGSFEAYWDSRGKNLRQNLRKQRRRLEEQGVILRLDCVQEAAELPIALTQYAALEGAGWKAQSGTSIGVANSQGRFYRSMLTEFSNKGLCRIYRYWMGDRVVAMDVCIDSGSLVVILKTAYDESLRHLSPAMLMREDLFRRWWSEGRYRRIEFYGRTMEWHTRWTHQQRALYHATLFRLPGLRELREATANWRLSRRPLGTEAHPPGAKSPKPQCFRESSP